MDIFLKKFLYSENMENIINVIYMILSILPYVGSKRNDIKFVDKYFPEIKSKSKIVEPFGGSGAVSLYLFSLNNKIVCHINDIDGALINFYHQLQKHQTLVLNGYNSLLNFKNKSEYDKIIEEFKLANVEGHSTIKDAVLYLFYHRVHGFRMGLYPSDQPHFKDIVVEDFPIFFEWIKKTTFTNESYEKIFSKYKNSKNVFMFIDPPYLDSFNAYYIMNRYDKEGVVDNTEVFVKISDYLKVAKCKCMLVINENAITNKLYGDYIVGTYEKLYQISKKKTIHIIAANFK